MTQRIREDQVYIENNTVSGSFLTNNGEDFSWYSDLYATISGIVFNEETRSHDFRMVSNTEDNMFLMDSSEDTIYFGGVINSVKISKGGEFTLEGDATRWDDLRVEPVARSTGTNAPTFEKWFDNGSSSRGVYLYSFDDVVVGSEKEIFFTMQTPHNWKLGTNLSLHIHWVGNVNDTLSSPRWGLEYNFKNIGEVFGNTQIIYTTSGNITPSGIDYNITQYKHYLSEFDDIVPDSSNSGLSSILIGRIFRNSSSVDDTYNESGNKCGILYIDIHYQIDSLGSREEYTK